MTIGYESTGRHLRQKKGQVNNSTRRKVLKVAKSKDANYGWRMKVKNYDDDDGVGDGDKMVI